MTAADPNEEARRWLERRVGRCHAAMRLGVEEEREARLFGQGRTVFHIENWGGFRGLVRLALRLSLMEGRGLRNARAVQLRCNDFVLPHLPPVFQGYTLLHLSDLHLDMGAGMPDALIEAVDGLQYDACVITGDFRAKTYGAYQAALDGMARVRPHLKGDIYAILGNHDSLRMAQGLEAMGVRLLLNETVALRRGGSVIHLAGIDDPHYYRADNLEKAADPIPAGGVSLLLSHSPEIYRQAASAGFDVMLAGHTHGGQICLPGGIPLIVNARAPRRYCVGAWRHQRMQGYTSVGSGASIADARFNCPPEVTLHRLLQE
ncbi:metallophosphoesterase [Methylogaea oryzae]|uniref:Metallophosphoesterase n=2 Tax=Methylogaea oryzae TaxID=1295382 RepID=A0A8D4VKT8_9GAMM|nr:metallophosphoesterase [Methylogaea oryzae]BBL69678.1 metallophosphoesterase [Methylogaea oryzae]